MNTIEQLLRSIERVARRVRDLESKTQQPDPAGWVDPGETWTYASATTFTIAGDLTDKYQAGDRLRWEQTTVKHGVITSVSYSDPNTTVTVNGDAVADATITANHYSKVFSPQGLTPDIWTWGQWSSTSWDGDSKNSADGIIDLSAVFGLPAGIKAVSLRLTIKDNSAGTYGALCQSSANNFAGIIARVPGANLSVDNAGVIPCDANGDIYWFQTATTIDEVYLYINGYLS